MLEQGSIFTRARHGAPHTPLFLAAALAALPSTLAGRVVISGAGPAGLLTAHATLRRLPSARVAVYDKRVDPRQAASSGARAYSLGLNIRGRTALEHWGLWEAVAQRGVLSSKFLLHLGSRELQLRANDADSVPSLLISRDALCSALLDELEARHAASGRLELRLGTPIERVDLCARECFAPTGEAIPYDDLIGADGINSVVRLAMEEARSSAFSSEVVDLPGKYKVMVQPCPPSLDPLAVHAMGANGYSLFSIPRADGQLCTLVAWSSAELPPVLQLPDAELGAAIAADLPKYGEPSQAALSQLRAQQPSKATTVRCSRYDDQPGHALLIGDAAHSTGGTLGQGANSALLDVLALDRLLERSAAADEQPTSIVQAVGAAFSAQQQPEGLALWQLLQLPPQGPLRLPYLAIQTARRVLAGLTRSLPTAVRVAPPVQSLLSESTMPFTEIVARNRAWVDAALASAPSGSAVAPFNDDAQTPPAA